MSLSLKAGLMLASTIIESITNKKARIAAIVPSKGALKSSTIKVGIFQLIVSAALGLGYIITTGDIESTVAAITSIYAGIMGLATIITRLRTTKIIK